MSTSAIYCRVSTSEQQKFGVSLSAQAARCQQYASLLGLNVVEVAIEAESAKDTNRPLLKGIIHKIQKKQIQHIITMKLDRLSRETDDAIRLGKLFAKRGCTLHLVSEGGPVDLADPSQELLFTMRAGMGKFERRRISLNTKFALDRKKQLGERISGQAPYGHKFVNGKVVEDENEQRIIKRVHQLHNKGDSQRKIIKQLTSEHLYNREGHAFTRPTITAILAREITWN